uniref:phosphatidylinositol 3-kinase n=1 Tax=Ditylenchus dipsaci TaxID=166011 RepID=A0A915CVA0_9BILA
MRIREIITSKAVLINSTHFTLLNCSNEEVDFADEYVQPRYTPTRNYPLTRECVHSYSRAGSLIFDASERNIFVNSNKLLGTCPCQSRLTQSIFTARHTSATEDEDIEVRVECPDMRRFCMCTESGQCYTTSGRVNSVGFTPYCDGGGCHMYAILDGESDSGLEGDQANIFRVSDQLQADGTPRRPSSDSIYLKAKSTGIGIMSALRSHNRLHTAENGFAYFYSSEVDVAVRVKVVSLYGYLAPPLVTTASQSNCMFLKLMVYCNGRRVSAREVQTSSFSASPTNGVGGRDLQKWNEWCSLPIKYCELSRDAMLHVSLWDVDENSIKPVFVAECWKSLFSKHGICRSGQLDLKMDTSGQATRQATRDQKCVTSEPDGQSIRQTKAVNKPVGDLADLLKREKLYKQNFIDRVNWLDKITFSKLEEIKHEAKTEDRSLYLTIEMPVVQFGNENTVYSIVFFAEDDDYLLNASLTNKVQSFNNNMLNTTPATNYRPTTSGPGYWIDPELGLDNLCEIKHHMLTRNARANQIDRRLQPNTSAKDAIESILLAPSCQPLSVEERTLYGSSVSGSSPILKLSPSSEWEPIEASDALELLAPSFSHPFVRRYAVSRLQRTTYANIILYLPQLVQALRYETKPDQVFDSKDVSSNSIVEVSNRRASKSDGLNTSCSSMSQYFGSADTDLASFLVRVACENSVIANFFYWYLKVEIEANADIDQIMSHMFANIMERFKQALSKGNSTARNTLATLSQQKKFVDALVEMAKLVAEVSGSRAKKLEVLKKKLAENHELMDLKGLSLPLDPSIHVKNIQAESTILFSSNLMPMRLTFSTVRGSVTPYESGEAYVTIFKKGDDLRQDQLVLSMIRLMDSLLKEEKLDLCLTPYCVLATSVTEGFVQFVKATPLADLKSIQETLRTFRPSSNGPYGIEVDVLNNYVRQAPSQFVAMRKWTHVSCGLRLHFRSRSKTYAPAMKLTGDMINAMGGQGSEFFKDFLDYCTTAYCILRRHANLIINLFSLMLDAGIPDIALERDRSVQKVLERFNAQLSDEEACQHVHRLIENSMSAKMPILVDFVHDVKQFISN